MTKNTLIVNKFISKTFYSLLKKGCFTIVLFFYFTTVSAVVKNLPIAPPGDFNDNVKDVEDAQNLPIDELVFIMSFVGCVLSYFVLHKKKLPSKQR